MSSRCRRVPRITRHFRFDDTRDKSRAIQVIQRKKKKTKHKLTLFYSEPHDGLNDDDDTLDEPSMLETHYRGHGSSSHHHHNNHHPHQPQHRKKDSRISEIGDLDDMDVLSESEVAFLRAAAKKQAQSSANALESSETSIGAALRLNDVVVLDVGGEPVHDHALHAHQVPRHLFRRPLWRPPTQVPRQADGSVFIDRDGTHFRNDSQLPALRHHGLAGGRARAPRSAARGELLRARHRHAPGVDCRCASADRDAEGEWRSNVIFIGTLNIDRTRRRPRRARARRRAGAVDVGNGLAVDPRSGPHRHLPDHQRRELGLLARRHQRAC
jgi:hypothetical protein